jgi:two-component system sensor kinase FixL
MPENAAQRDALFRTLISTAVDGIIVTDERGHIRIFSNACERLFGYAQHEALNQNVKMLMPEPYRSEHDGYVAHYKEMGERRIIGIGREVVGQRKDGTTFPMYLSVGEGRLEGEIIFVGIVRDLSKEKRGEAKFKELQSELLHVSRLDELGQMASALAHELNQPLTAIMNYIKAARRTLETAGASSIPKAQELLDKAAAQATRAGEIIRHLRAFIGKRETGRSQENINAVVEEAVAFGSVGAADANLRLKLDLDRALEPILIDRVQIQQVLINLIRNASEAMQSVSRRELTVTTARTEKDVVEIAVIDTGPGLPPEVVERLFQPFVTTKDKGMGIGLSICKSIIEAHGGRIWAEPNAGGGTAFRFRLPILDQSEAAK